MKSKFLIVVLGLFFSFLLIAQEEERGFASVRIENEYKLVVPVNQQNGVWEYLNRTYLNQDFLAKIGSDISATSSEEYFSDTYYDNDDFFLLNSKNGIRKRTRLIPDNPAHPKHGRNLIQIKLIDVNNPLNRYEIKYPLENKKSIASRRTPGELIKEKYRNDYDRRLRVLGIRDNDLFPALTILQKRQRIYVKVNGQPFLTLTLDEASSTLFFFKVSLIELEIELNEVGFTNATMDERMKMSQISSLFKDDIKKEFPSLMQDQTPKYNKIYAELSKKTSVLNLLSKLRSWFY